MRQDHNAHEINTKKSDQIVSGSASRPHKVPIVVQKGNKFKQVLLSEHSSITTNGLHSQKDLAELWKNTTQRIISTKFPFLFYLSDLSVSVLQYCSTTWYKKLSTTSRSNCSKIVRQPLEELYESAKQRRRRSTVPEPNRVPNSEQKKKSCVHRSVLELTLNLVSGLDLRPGASKAELVECVDRLQTWFSLGAGKRGLTWYGKQRMLWCHFLLSTSWPVYRATFV